MFIERTGLSKNKSAVLNSHRVSSGFDVKDIICTHQYFDDFQSKIFQ